MARWRTPLLAERGAALGVGRRVSAAMRRGRSGLLAPLVAAGLFVGLTAGCGSDGGGSSETSAGTATTTTPVDTTSSTAPAPLAGSIYGPPASGGLGRPTRSGCGWGRWSNVGPGGEPDPAGRALGPTTRATPPGCSPSGERPQLGIFTLAGAEARRLGDMALGPDVDDSGEPVADTDALYLADIGDNDFVRAR